MRLVHIILQSNSNFVSELGPRCCSIVYVILSGTGLEPLQDFRARRSSFNVNSVL